MSSGDTPPDDPYAFLGITRKADGSITRPPDFSPATSDPSDPVFTKDIPVNPQTKTWIRLYVPRPEPDVNPPAKLPLLVYYHGGGLIFGSAASSFCQKFCHNIVRRMPAVMASVDYRLAPEHRLPAAYDDGFEALQWIRSTDDEWVMNYADLSKCFLFGSSAGGNIAFHVGLRVAASTVDLKPLKIQGLILHQTFLGGVQRTPSEIRCANAKPLPVFVSDMMWDLALPVGADHDHEYCNQTAHIKSELVEKVKNEGWKIMVTGCDGDPLHDRQVALAHTLKDKGVDVIPHFRSGGCHGVEFFVDTLADMFYDDLKNFLLAFQ